MSAQPREPSWYPDPTRRHEHRWWDGSAWTDHVADQGQSGTDPFQGGRLFAPPTLDTVRSQVAKAGGGVEDAIGGGTIFSEPVLVVNQRAKVMELVAQFAVFDRRGTHIAYVEQVGQGTGKKVLRALTSLDQYMTHHYEIRDRDGAPLLRLTRPRKVFTSSVIVSAPDGREIGRIVQENVIGTITFTIEADGCAIASIRAENWRAWNLRIEDASGAEVARITKTFEGVMKTAFTTADNYVVHLHARLPEPLHTLVVASALSVDTALKQDARGLG